MNLTVCGVIGVILISFIIISDIVLMIKKHGQESSTWSEMLRVAFWYTAAVPWGLGVWIGHWFPIVQKPLFKYSWILVIGLSVGLLIFDIFFNILKIKEKYPVMLYIFIPVSVITGLFVGGLFWPLIITY